MKRLGILFDAMSGTPSARREAERRVRWHAVAWARARHGGSQAEAAKALRLSERTLGEWEANWREGKLSPNSRGRPRKGATREDQARMLGLLWVLGPNAGWEALRPHLPGVGRRELRRLLARTRKRWKRLGRAGALALTWNRPGAVWAMDFTEPPAPIEGQYDYILLVRDLASGATLAALPCPDETARTAMDALRSLFLEHGAPLVLKADNGPAFIADELRALCKAQGVTLLYSPPHYPPYNGSCEAGGGSIKTRAHHLAARQGRPGEWTLDDVEGARLQANETGRPHGASAPVPGERWKQRPPISDSERGLFVEAVAKRLLVEQAERGFSAEHGPDKNELASCTRAAIARTLCEQGILEFRTRRVSLPISSFLSAVIS